MRNITLDREQFEAAGKTFMGDVVRNLVAAYREGKNVQKRENDFLKSLGVTKKPFTTLTPMAMASLVIKLLAPQGAILMRHTKKDTHIITRHAKIMSLHGQEKGRKMLKAEEKKKMEQLTEIVNRHAPKTQHARLPEIFEEIRKELSAELPEVFAEYCIVPSKEKEYSLSKPVLLIRLEIKGKEKYLEFTGKEILRMGGKNPHGIRDKIRQELGETLSEEIVELFFKSFGKKIEMAQGKPRHILKRNDEYIAAFAHDGKNVEIYSTKKVKHLIKSGENGEEWLNFPKHFEYEERSPVGEIDRIFNYGERQIILEAKGGAIKSRHIHALKNKKAHPIQSLFSTKERKAGIILCGKKSELYSDKGLKGRFRELSESPYVVSIPFPFDSLVLEKCDSQLKTCEKSEFDQLLEDIEKAYSVLRKNYS